jgi:hypothetical protein
MCSPLPPLHSPGFTPLAIKPDSSPDSNAFPSRLTLVYSGFVRSSLKDPDTSGPETSAPAVTARGQTGTCVLLACWLGTIQRHHIPGRCNYANTSLADVGIKGQERSNHRGSVTEHEEGPQDIEAAEPTSQVCCALSIEHCNHTCQLVRVRLCCQ